MSEFGNSDYNFEEETEGMQEAQETEGKGKKKGKKAKTGKKAGTKLTVALIAIAAAFVVFVVLIALEDKLINSVETVPVVVATVEVPEGIYLDETNMPNYFTIEQRPATEVPAGVTTYSNGTPMIGMITDRVIRAKEVVTSDCFYEEDFYEGIDDPVELSINLSSIGQTVGGILRAGDYVDIYAVIKTPEESLLSGVEPGLLDVDEEKTDGLLDVAPTEGLGAIVTEQDGTMEQGNAVSSDASNSVVVGEDGSVVVEDNQLSDAFELSYGVTGDYVSQVVAQNVRIVRVFTSGGETTESVEANGGQMIATVINVVVPRNMVDAILIAQEEGSITLSRVENPFYGVDTEAEESAEDVVEGENTEAVTEGQGATVVQ